MASGDKFKPRPFIQRPSGRSGRVSTYLPTWVPENDRCLACRSLTKAYRFIEQPAADGGTELIEWFKCEFDSCRWTRVSQ